MMYVVCYDITDDGRRIKICNLLKDFGTHVQYSVFECDLTEGQLADLVAHLREILDEGEDYLRVYRLCERCLQDALIFGRGRLSFDEDFYIV